MTRLWIRDPAVVLTDDPDPTAAARGLIVAGNRIDELVPAGADPMGGDNPPDTVFDATDCVVTPGLINTHHHFYQTLTRAHPAALNKELFDWLVGLYPVWAQLTPEMVSISSRTAMAELLLSGCTTTTDHHYVFPPGHEDAIDRQVAAAEELGIRAVLTRGSMDLSQKDGGLPPDSVVQDRDTILADCERLIDRFHDPAPDAQIQIALAPCSPFSVSRDLMEQTAALANARNVRLHTHLGETEDENAYCTETMGCRPLDYLEACGWLDEPGRVWLAHGIHFDADEIARLARAQVGVSSCSHSNMILGSGICPVCTMEAAGVPVGLGVDGSASNDAGSMIAEVRQAFLLQRLVNGPGNVSHLDALRWATAGSAALIGRGDGLGRIAPGFVADLVVFRLSELHFAGAHDPLAAIVTCGARTADAVMVDGRWVVRNGALLDCRPGRASSRPTGRRHNISLSRRLESPQQFQSDAGKGGEIQLLANPSVTFILRE